MKRVWVFRHCQQEDLGLGLTSWAIPAPLTEQGRKLARRVARLHQDSLKECTIFATSPIIRAQQTLYEMMMVLGHDMSTLEQKVRFFTELWTKQPEGWVSGDPNETVRSLWKKDPRFVQAEGAEFLLSLQKIAINIPDNSKVLSVSHGGPLDAGLAMARRTLGRKNAFAKIRDLKKGEGVIFDFDAFNRLIKVIELRFP